MSAPRKRLYYIWQKLSERQSRKKLRLVFFKHDLKRFKNSTNLKTTRRQAQEMKALHRYWGCYPFQYYRFDFYKQECALSVEEMKTYVPFYFLHHLYFPLSYKEYGVLCEDKLLTYVMLKAYDVPQPTMLFCFDHNTFFDGANNPMTSAEVNARISASQATTLFVKPRFGSEGKGISICNKQGGGFIGEGKMPFDHTFFSSGVPAKPLLLRDT